MTAGNITRTLVCAAVLVAPLLGGCQGVQCADIAIRSEATLTVHLTPASDVAAPETVTVCQQPTCFSAGLPPLVGQDLADMTFSPDVHGMVKAQAGGVRRLTISWELTDVIPSSPANQYDVKVKDGRGITTGELSGAINYTHLVDEECHVDVWQGALAD